MTALQRAGQQPSSVEHSYYEYPDLPVQTPNFRYFDCLAAYLPESVVELIDRICIFIASFFDPALNSLINRHNACLGQLDRALTTSFQYYCPKLRNGEKGRYAAQFILKFNEKPESCKSASHTGIIDPDGTTSFIDERGAVHLGESNFRRLFYDTHLSKEVNRHNRFVQDFTLLFTIFTKSRYFGDRMDSLSFAMCFNPNGEGAFNAVEPVIKPTDLRNMHNIETNQHWDYDSFQKSGLIPQALKDIVSEEDFTPVKKRETYETKAEKEKKMDQSNLDSAYPDFNLVRVTGR
ncbi:MAG: hypothetical protein HYX48_00140 [Chlamydiales bacterium]|nr:hypothetical protein [Chlamydiales bacterium]